MPTSATTFFAANSAYHQTQFFPPRLTHVQKISWTTFCQHAFLSGTGNTEVKYYAWGMGIDKARMVMLADENIMNGATEWANRLRYNFDTPHLCGYISMPYLNLHRQSAPINSGRLHVNYNERARAREGKSFSPKYLRAYYFICINFSLLSMRLAGSVDLYPQGVP